VTVFREGCKGAAAVLVRGAGGEIEVAGDEAGDCGGAQICG
jgi:hypothetical protein